MIKYDLHAAGQVAMGGQMGSDQEFVDFVCDQMRGAGAISFRKMFGEYAIYCRGKVVGLVCDNQLFIKPTGGGRSLVGNGEEAPPYPGAKNYFLVGDRIDDREWVSRLVCATEKDLPAAKPKKSKLAGRQKKPGGG